MPDLFRLFYTLGLPTGFSPDNKLRAAVRSRAKSAAGVREWLETKDDYTMHRSVRTKFPRNPYTVSKRKDV
jgi:hypothetical protein